MKRLNGREAKALLFLSIILPVGLLTTFRLTGVLQGPTTITITETVTLEPVIWEFQRPSYIADIWKMLDTQYMGESAQVHFAIFVDDYTKNDALYGGLDCVALSVNLTASVANGHVKSMHLVFREKDENSRLNFFEEHQLPRYENVTRLNYTDWAREISMSLTGVNQPQGVSFWAPVDWTLAGPRNLDHELDAILDVSYFNGTVYKKIVQPFELKVLGG